MEWTGGERASKILGMLLALAMLVGMVPLSAFAKDVEGEGIDGWGWRTENRYLTQYSKKNFPNEYDQRFHGLTHTNYEVTLDKSGKTYAAFCFNMNRRDPHGAKYVQKYENADANEFNALADNNIKDTAIDFRRSVLWAVYLGYPYNKGCDGTQEGYFKERAVNFYNIPEDLADDALHLATQIAVWYFTDYENKDEKGNPLVKFWSRPGGSQYDPKRFEPIEGSYDSEKMGDPVTYLAADLIRKAQGESLKEPPLHLDLYKPVNGSSRQNILVTDFANHGALKISKEVLATDGADYSDSEFDVVVTLEKPDGRPLDPGTYGDVKLADSDREIKVRVSKSHPIFISRLPEGTKYTVQELPSDGWSIKGQNKFAGVIVAEQTVETNFVNELKKSETPQGGELRITKRVEGANPGPDHKFHFTVTLNSPNGQPLDNAAYGPYNVEGGKISLDISPGQTVVIPGLPAGTKYVVKEDESEQWTVVKTGDSGDITAVGENEAIFINKAKDVPQLPDRTSLTIRKEVSGAAAPSTDLFDFKVTLMQADSPLENVACKIRYDGEEEKEASVTGGVLDIKLSGGKSATIMDLPVGVHYSVEEKKDTHSYTSNPGDELENGYVLREVACATGIIQAGGQGSDIVTFRNEKKEPPITPLAAKLVIEKRVEGGLSDQDGIDEAFEFDIHLADEAFSKTIDGIEFKNGWASIRLKAEESRVIDGLPQGEVVVSERRADGWEKKDPETRILQNGVETDVVFVNTRMKPSEPKPETPPKPSLVSITASKVWRLDDGGEQASSVIATLMKDGVEWDTAELSAANKWTHTWRNLSKDADWTIEEKNVPEGFISTVTGDGRNFVITNDDVPKKSEPVSVTVAKRWITDDGGVVSPFVSVVLLKDGQVEDTVFLSQENEWSYSWSGLDADHVWMVDEIDVPAGFQHSVTGENGVFTIVNDDVSTDCDIVEKFEPSNKVNAPIEFKATKRIPQTNDKVGGFAWVMLALGVAGGATGLLLWRKKFRRDKQY